MNHNPKFVSEKELNLQKYSHYNYTGKLENHQNGKSTDGGVTLDAKTIVFLIMRSFIVLENLIVLVAIWKNQKFHIRMYFFIANLALCDLLAGVAYIANLLMSGEKTLHLSPVLGFVREGSIIVALGAFTFRTCWLIAISLGALPILGWNCLDNLADCSMVLPLYTKKYVAFCIITFMALLLDMSILYIRIYTLVYKHSNLKNSMTLLHTVIIVVGVFITCWTPIFALLLIDVAYEHRRCSILYKADYFIALAVLNSAMNPVIYTLASREMRNAFFSLVCSCLMKGKVSSSGGPNKPRTQQEQVQYFCS
ncbi:unnamed protein product [Coregonus sp. 'balchen']|nr:unnamed protein product [Coregonus sp. 'balchen']